MLNKAGRCSSAGEAEWQYREGEAEDVNKERLASDKDDVAAFVSLMSQGKPIGSCILF